jgi:hypothetical protein
MRKFEFTISETREAIVKIIVEAESESEARDKAESGETLSEETITACQNVLGRLIID